MRRFPWLTLVVAVITLAGLVVEQTVPGTLADLERTPTALHGEWWRWLTSLVVQDGHVVGGVFNIVGLLLCGIAAEQVVGRLGWLTAYVGAGLVGQLFGQLWQPVGGGNSVAVCGLAAVCVVAVVRGRGDRLPLMSFAPVYWCGSLASALWWPLLTVGVLLAIVAAGPGRGLPWMRYVVAGFCSGCALALLLARDLHGGTLCVALVVCAAADRMVKVGVPSRHRP